MNKAFDKENNDNPVVDLGLLFKYLSQSKGKLEVTFQKNENPEYESLCLVFIKIPIYGPVVSILRKMIESDKYDKQPLSKGKLSIDSKDSNLFALVGAIRIKSIDKAEPILISMIERMRGMLRAAITISKRDDIGNIDIQSSGNTKQRRYVTQNKPHTFGIKTGKDYGETSSEEDD